MLGEEKREHTISGPRRSHLRVCVVRRAAWGCRDHGICCPWSAVCLFLVFLFSLFLSLDIWSSTLASPARSSNVSFPVLTACRVRRAPRYFGEGEDAVVIPQMCPFPIGEKWGYGEGRENGSHGGCVQHAEMEMGEPLRAHVFFFVCFCG